MPADPKGHLPRLERHFYERHAVVFWTNIVEGRSQGWLSPTFHAAFREVMLHAAARYAVWSPAYCLMPDHLHLIWMGMRLDTDQLNAIRFLRAELSAYLGAEREWQHQAYDHVLREEERRRNAFALTCGYVLENPVRAGLVTQASEWPFSGAILPGYNRLHPQQAGYWPTFWKIYSRARENESGISVSPDVE